MKVGDLVSDLREVHWDVVNHPQSIGVGIVTNIIDDVEIPPMIEVMWDNGYISKVSKDELSVLSEFIEHEIAELAMALADE
jgi:hypothetical protein